MRDNGYLVVWLLYMFYRYTIVLYTVTSFESLHSAQTTGFFRSCFRVKVLFCFRCCCCSFLKVKARIFFFFFFLIHFFFFPFVFVSNSAGWVQGNGLQNNFTTFSISLSLYKALKNLEVQLLCWWWGFGRRSKWNDPFFFYS